MRMIVNTVSLLGRCNRGSADNYVKNASPPLKIAARASDQGWLTDGKRFEGDLIDCGV